jgi:hypothetical protein
VDGKNITDCEKEEDWQNQQAENKDFGARLWCDFWARLWCATPLPTRAL